MGGADLSTEQLASQRPHREAGCCKADGLATWAVEQSSVRQPPVDSARHTARWGISRAPHEGQGGGGARTLSCPNLSQLSWANGALEASLRVACLQGQQGASPPPPPTGAKPTR